MWGPTLTHILAKKHVKNIVIQDKLDCHVFQTPNKQYGSVLCLILSRTVLWSRKRHHILRRLKFKCQVNCPFKVSGSATANLKFSNRPSPEHAVLRVRSVLHHPLSAPTYPVMQGDRRGAHTWWSLPLRLGISFEEEAFESRAENLKNTLTSL